MLTPEQARAAWTRLSPLIAAALRHARGTHALDDVWAAVAAGEAQFWPAAASAVVTEIHRFPRRSALHFWLVGGELTELLAMLPHVESWGRAQGCDLFTLAGRRGWARALRSRGYVPAWTGLAKEAA